jgi:hypothetical protein
VCCNHTMDPVAKPKRKPRAPKPPPEEDDVIDCTIEGLEPVDQAEREAAALESVGIAPRPLDDEVVIFKHLSNPQHTDAQSKWPIGVLVSSGGRLGLKIHGDAKVEVLRSWDPAMAGERDWLLFHVKALPPPTNVFRVHENFNSAIQRFNPGAERL